MNKSQVTHGARHTTPRTKQRTAFQAHFKGGKHIADAMRVANYRPATIQNPKNLTESKGWNELLNKYMPDDYLTQKHRELLEKRDKKQEYDPITKRWIEVESEAPETNAVSKGLDMAYKLKKKYDDSQKHLHLHIGDEELELANRALSEIDE